MNIYGSFDTSYKLRFCLFNGIIWLIWSKSSEWIWGWFLFLKFDNHFSPVFFISRSFPFFSFIYFFRLFFILFIFNFRLNILLFRLPFDSCACHYFQSSSNLLIQLSDGFPERDQQIVIKWIKWPISKSFFIFSRPCISLMPLSLSHLREVGFCNLAMR